MITDSLNVRVKLIFQNMMYNIHNTDCTVSTVLCCRFVESWTQTVMSIALLPFMGILLLWSSVVAYAWTRWMFRWPSSHLMVLFIIQICEPWCSEFKSPWSLMLMSSFPSLMACSNNSGWDHVAGESHSPHSCCCARHCQLSQAVSFLKWG